MHGAESWSTQQLTEFLALVSSFSDAAGATRGAVERAAEAVEAEVVALVRDGAVVASVGFPDDRVPRDELLALAAQGSAVRARGCRASAPATSPAWGSRGRCPAGCSPRARATRTSAARNATCCAAWHACWC